MNKLSTPRLAKSSLKSTQDISAPRKSSEYPSISYHINIFNTLSASLLLGNPAKAERVLGWKRKVDFNSLVQEMVEADVKAAKSLVEDQN